MITGPEKNKKPGLCYAVTDDGIELPVIDITHAAFELNVTPESLSAAIDQFVQNLQLQSAPSFTTRCYSGRRSEAGSAAIFT